MQRLVLLDGNAILHRAYHALPPLTNPKGELTNAVYGFVSMLLRVIEDLQPTHIVVTFDRPAPTFRKELFKEYQAQRPEMEDGLSQQVDKVHRVVKAMDIPIYEKDGFEADDVIGTLAKQAQQKMDEIVIVTGDRDLLQLVNGKVKLYMPVKGLTEAKLFGKKEATERMGVTPEHVVDLKALMGDPSDNYPGVAGIGPKTAIGLIEQFGTVENIYKHLKDIKKTAVVTKLESDRDNAFLSKKLATVVTDAPVTFDRKKSELNDLLTKAVIDVFGEMGFKTLLKRLTKLSGKEVADQKKQQTEEQMGLF